MTNYIRHLNAFFSFVRSDKRLTSSHVSLYMALFQYWNLARFQNPFPVNRQNLMQLSKIGSKNTYHKCLRELHTAQYIVYHTSPSKFQPVKISVVRLDGERDEGRLKQLILFSPAHEKSSIDSGIQPVSDLGRSGAKSETECVPDSGHSLNANTKKINGVQHTPTILFEKNHPWEKKMNALAGGPNLGPPLIEVETFFVESNLSPTEARKFYYYNQGKSWMLTETIPVTDWKALARKWMLNPRRADERPQLSPEAQMIQAIQYLYDRYREGGRINKLLLPEYADYLKLEVSDALKKEALQRRINQLSGSNEASENRLWEAYIHEQWTDLVVLNDQPNLTSLARRLALLQHFQTAKAKGTVNIISSPTKANDHEH